MHVTLDESITVYARATLKWFGAKARKRTRERIEQLVRGGDLEGAKIHERVRARILQLEQQGTLAPAIFLRKGSLISPSEGIFG
jgi:hypothetical protein